MHTFIVRPEQIEGAWPALREHFERFESAGHDLSADEAKHRAKESRLQIWGVQDGAQVLGIVTTEIMSTAHGPVCVVTAAQGMAPEAPKRELMEAIRRFASENGCKKIRLHGRKGWLRWDRRFVETGIIAEMNLT